MRTLLYSDDAFLEHDTGVGHPERADRLRSVSAALNTARFAQLLRFEPREATVAEIERVHAAGYVEGLLGMVPKMGSVHIDADTVLSPGSGTAALRGAGALVAAVDTVLSRLAERAFCAVRPPGHHAEPGRGMGFCLFNNVAIGAAHALDAHGLERVAILDFDVHHGNGTQAAFWDEPRVLFGSSHQMPLYPGTGAAAETGAGNIINMPLDPGARGMVYREAWESKYFPRLEAFHPQLIFFSAGFDGHEDDPLANLNLHERDFAWITSEVVRIANEACEGRIISTLEGGYDLDALGRSVAAHVGALAEV
jgi:acetoin utilization deacetylase AcuC-like enzyme